MSVVQWRVVLMLCVQTRWYCRGTGSNPRIAQIMNYFDFFCIGIIYLFFIISFIIFVNFLLSLFFIVILFYFIHFLNAVQSIPASCLYNPLSCVLARGKQRSFPSVSLKSIFCVQPILQNNRKKSRKTRLLDGVT